ncbi:MAG: AAA family ATP:ADP antiporter [Myxococcota bacterium]|jgi:AAA family ATP:ADP antiporter
MYATVGLGALLAIRGMRGVFSRFPPGVAFALTAIAGACVYVGIFAAIGRSQSQSWLLILYVYSSVIGSVLIVQFWTVLSSSIDIRDAKRQFAFIGAGSVSGAIAGSAVATAAAQLVDARYLLLVAAAGFVLAGIFGWVSLGGGVAKAGPTVEPTLRDGARALRTHPYPKYVAAIVVLAAIVFTFSDFVFKATVADAVDAEDLASTFALVYLVLNVGSLFVQLALVTPLINRLQLNSVSALTPSLTALAAGGVVALGTLPAAIGLRAIDGLFKHTVHRTATELLYVPMLPEVRGPVKRLIDVAGHRGGQIVASGAVLLVLWLGGGSNVLGVLLVVSAVAWIGVAVAMRQPYLDLFRRSLRSVSRSVPAAATDLDLASVETLLAALNSDVDRDVLVAVDILHRQGKASIIPALILHHPSDEVVAGACRVFAEAGRKDVVPLIDRLLANAAAQGNPLSSRVGALVRARFRLASDVEAMRMLVAEDRPSSRAVAAAELLMLGTESVAAQQDLVHRVYGYATPCQIEFLHTVSFRTDVFEMSGALREVLVTLSQRDAPVGEAALRAIGATHDVACTPIIVEALGRRDVMLAARDVLVQLGDDAVAASAAMLRDVNVSETIRLELPRVLAGMGRSASDFLTGQLVREHTGMVAYRVLCALENLVVEWPDARPEPQLLAQVVRDHLEAAERYSGLASELERAATDREDVRNRAHPLLVRLLRERQRHAVQRATRVYGLSFAQEDFRSISMGLSSEHRKTVISSVELLEASTDGEWSAIAVAAERLLQPEYTSRSRRYGAVLVDMMSDSSSTVRELAQAQRDLLARAEAT